MRPRGRAQTLLVVGPQTDEADDRRRAPAWQRAHLKLVPGTSRALIVEPGRCARRALPIGFSSASHTILTTTGDAIGMLPWSLITVIAVLILVVLATGGEDEPDAASARQAALQWTGAELTDAPRRTGEGWEVDVRRSDGSLVEVEFGTKLELREFDEERGAGGSPAHDEVTGDVRERAIETARTVSGPGSVRSVEREHDGSIEVNIAPPDSDDHRRGRARPAVARHGRR